MSNLGIKMNNRKKSKFLNFKKQNKAFTLVELLVVIAIIGILTAVFVAVLSNARARSRDAKRSGDINQIRKAIELYYNEAGEYPPTSMVTAGGSVGYDAGSGTTTFMAVIPSPPTPADGDCSSTDNLYTYTQTDSGASYTLNYCTGRSTGGLGAGTKRVTPDGTTTTACNPTTCLAEGKDCGTIDDGCGGTLSCGTCSGQDTCVSNVCTCQPTTCGAEGAECGTLADGCGVDLSCGTCSGEEVCAAGGTANLCFDSTPATFTFTDQTDVTKSTLTSSNSVTITGIGSPGYLTVSTSCQTSNCANAEVNCNSEGWASTCQIEVNESLQVRMTSSSDNLTAETLRVTVGTVSDDWSITTTCVNEWASCGDDYTDCDDGQSYGTVEIGTQCWFSDSMNVGTYVTADGTDNGVIEKRCYGDNESNCDIYGAIYEWNEAMTYSTTQGARGICPSGWHIPSYADWTILEEFYGGEGCRASDGMNACSPAGTALAIGGESGFDALYGGWKNWYSFNYISSNVRFWTSNNHNYQRVRIISLSADTVYDSSNNGVYAYTEGSYVRCLKD